jgi:hypothetical protein
MLADVTGRRPTFPASRSQRPSIWPAFGVLLLVGPTAAVLMINSRYRPATIERAEAESPTPLTPPSESEGMTAWESTPQTWPVNEPAVVSTSLAMAIKLPPFSFAPARVPVAFRPVEILRPEPIIRSFQRRSTLFFDPSRDPRSYSVASISQLMLAAPEVSLLPANDRTTRLFRAKPADDAEPILTLLDNRADLAGLPVLRGQDCRQADGRFGDFGKIARDLRTACASVAGRSSSFYWPTYSAGFRDSVSAMPAEQVAPLLLQMLQCDQPPMRRLLVDYARRDVRPETTGVLAQRALYETSIELRRDAVTALAGRTPDAVRPMLLAALRHPWPMIADNAATALIALNDQDAVPDLVDLLEQPNPAAPFDRGDGTRLVREVVRVNHARNCQMCHATSWDGNDPARVAVPSPLEPLPPSFSTKYYEQGDLLVRADVTYLRQDFSMVLPATDPGRWPAEQRYDFFVRVRKAIPSEKMHVGQDWHHSAVLRALRAITGRDYGESADEWRAGLQPRG